MDRFGNVTSNKNACRHWKQRCIQTKPNKTNQMDYEKKQTEFKLKKLKKTKKNIGQQCNI